MTHLVPTRPAASILPSLVFTALALAGCGGEGKNPTTTASDPAADSSSRAGSAAPLPTQGDLLFVVRGPGRVTGDSIEIEADSVEWFTDRPQRRAGVAPAGQLVANWNGYGFADVPPNAAVAEPRTDAVVKLERPKKVPGGIAFELTPIEGQLRHAEGEEVSLFIDSPDDLQTILARLKPGDDVDVGLTGGAEVSGSFVGTEDNGEVLAVSDPGRGRAFLPLDKVEEINGEPVSAPHRADGLQSIVDQVRPGEPVDLLLIDGGERSGSFARLDNARGGSLVFRDSEGRAESVLVDQIAGLILPQA